jgi:hypothetical protein
VAWFVSHEEERSPLLSETMTPAWTSYGPANGSARVMLHIRLVEPFGSCRETCWQRGCPSYERTSAFVQVFGRRAPNRGNVVEDPLWDRIADDGNPGCQGQGATQLGPGPETGARSRKEQIRDRVTAAIIADGAAALAFAGPQIVLD